MKNRNEKIAYLTILLGAILWMTGTMVADIDVNSSLATADNAMEMALTGGLALLLAGAIAVTLANTISISIAIAVTVALAGAGSWELAWSLAVFGGAAVGIGLAVLKHKTVLANDMKRT